MHFFQLEINIRFCDFFILLCKKEIKNFGVIEWIGKEVSCLVYECLNQFLIQVEAEQESDACACEQEIKPLTGIFFLLLLR